MPGTLESLLVAHQASLLAAWEARILETRPLGPAPSREDVRAHVRDAYAELLAAVRAPGGSLHHSHAPRTLVPVAAEPGTADAFQRALAARAPQGCHRCLALQDDQRTRVERRLDSVVEHSLDATVLCDKDGVIESWNGGARALLGRAEVETVGRSLAVLAPPDESATWLSTLLARTHAEGHVRAAETALVRPDGTRVRVDAGFTSVRDAGGRAVGLWAVFRDMTEQRRLVTENLHAERLALIGTMSARFAHEIRNPLSSILLNLDLIRDSLARRAPAAPSADDHGALPGEDDDVVRSIAGEVGRIQGVVQEYLRFARLPRTQRKPLAIDAALHAHVAMLAPEFRARGLELELAFAAGERVVLADEDQLWQVVLNLLKNALDATPRGGRVRVETRAVAQGVECVVADDGPGIPPESHERIFDPFYSTKHAGTGLGLPFVRQVLAEHGAPLKLDSVPGGGARFSFVLPSADDR